MKKLTRRESIVRALAFGGATLIRDLRWGAAAAPPPPPRPRGGKPLTKAVVAKWTPKPYPKDEVNLIAMGDWGSGLKEQKGVANGLAGYVGQIDKQFNAMLSAGDNFYVGLRNEEDQRFQELFEDMFDAKRVNFPVYGALGNHDYQGRKSRIEMAYAAKHPDSRWKMPARWYRVDLPAERPIVTVLMLDSNKPEITADDWLAQMRWIDEQLGQAKAAGRWTVACAHHPLFSNGAHGDNGVLQVHWGPIFRRHRLDFYQCGHDHDLQQLQIPDWPTSFLCTGGGGQKPTKMRRDLRGPFSRSLNGFAHLSFTPERATVQYLNAADIKVVHHMDRLRDGKINLVMKGGADKASNQPLRVLLGLDEDERNGTVDPDDPDP